MRLIRLSGDWERVEYIKPKNVVNVIIENTFEDMENGERKYGYIVFVTYKKEGGEYVSSLNFMPIKWLWVAKLYAWWRLL